MQPTYPLHPLVEIMRKQIPSLISVLVGQVVLNGCVLVGGFDDERPRPEESRNWPSTQFVLPATRPIKDQSEYAGLGVWVGVTTTPPEQIL